MGKTGKTPLFFERVPWRHSQSMTEVDQNQISETQARILLIIVS